MSRPLIPLLVVLFSLPSLPAMAQRHPSSATACKTRDKEKTKKKSSKRTKKESKRGRTTGKKKSKRGKTAGKKKSSKKSKRASAAARKRAAKREAARKRKERAAARKKRAAEQREIRRLRRYCRPKKRKKTAKCRRFARQEKRRAERRRVERLKKKCASRKHRRSRECRSFAREQRDKTFRAQFCGERRRRARKGDTVRRFSKRYKISTATFRRLNEGRGSRLKAGKRYVIYRSPHAGRKLHGGKLLEAGDGVGFMQRPHRGWGTPMTVDTIALAAARVQALWPHRAPVVVGDLSKKGGGCLPPHRSHRDGRDADIGFYVRGGVTPRWLGLVTAESIDADRTWAMLDVFLQTKRLRYAFIDYALQKPLYEAALRAGQPAASLRAVFQYPRPRSQSKVGIIRHLRGHADHMHVRFDCPTSGPCTLPASAVDTIWPGAAARLAGVRARRDRGSPRALMRRGPTTRHAGRRRRVPSAMPRGLP